MSKTSSMKKWLYIVVPVIMLAGFILIYLSHVEEAEAREKVRQEQIAKEKAEAEEKKRIAEAKAREDARKRQEEREAEERKKEEERRAKQAAEDKKVRDQTEQYLAEGRRAAAEVAKLQSELDNLRAHKNRLIRETFDIAKQVELARVARRNAELEIQRMTEMVVRRASNSMMARPPAPAVPAS